MNAGKVPCNSGEIEGRVGGDGGRARQQCHVESVSRADRIHVQVDGDRDSRVSGVHGGVIRAERDQVMQRRAGRQEGGSPPCSHGGQDLLPDGRQELLPDGSGIFLELVDRVCALLGWAIDDRGVQRQFHGADRLRLDMIIELSYDRSCAGFQRLLDALEIMWIPRGDALELPPGRRLVAGGRVVPRSQRRLVAGRRVGPHGGRGRVGNRAPFGPPRGAPAVRLTMRTSDRPRRYGRCGRSARLWPVGKSKRLGAVCAGLPPPGPPASFTGPLVRPVDLDEVSVTSPCLSSSDGAKRCASDPFACCPRARRAHRWLETPRGAEGGSARR